ncbi:E3 ubiquitin-protein ligase TRIM7-like [Heteronotia binoei]|uniref:E3 ubiquitin-protein ligase TRIM7-like n=1 Tax=Heteronotia binoei TaxID=13085 RepID=UPI00292E46E5|nr:E3 ubiquitin-protein ligase TRIM7-like [Heteronotia binoei]
MAAEGPVQELCQEATCAICLDYFSDPVTITECGHSFCRGCLDRSWQESRVPPCCPQCRSVPQPRKVRLNRQLANFVAIIKKLRPSEEEEPEAKGGFCEKHQEPLEFFCKEDEAPVCVICGLSREHRYHEVVPLEEAFQGNRLVVAARKGRVCQNHQKLLKLFCKDDEALICVVCHRWKEHSDHKTLSLEASQEYKDQFCCCLKFLKEERERIVAYKGDVEKESQDLLKQTKREKQKTSAAFKELHTFLEEQEDLLLAQIEEVEKQVARKRDQHLTKLSEALSSLESLIQETEEKCQQSATDLLKDARSTLQRYKEEETFENPVTLPLPLPRRIWDFCDINHSLKGVTKQLKAVDVKLDPDTAHPKLILSKDWKRMRLGEIDQALPNNPERFDRFGAILGLEGFTAGRHFWEVCVGNEEEWVVGVAIKSMRRKGYLALSPEGEMWAVGKWWGSYRASEKDHYFPVTLTGELKRIRVYMNYSGGRVAFFNADQADLLYEFSRASFSGETLLPFFWVCKKGHLKIS